MSLSQVNVKLDRSVLINMAQITINTIKTCIHNCSMWSKLSHMVSIVTCCHNCHLWSQLSHVVTIVTCGHNCHIRWQHVVTMWLQLSHITIVRCVNNCHMWSQLPHVVTIATCGHNCHIWSQLSHAAIQISIFPTRPPFAEDMLTFRLLRRPRK